MIGYGEGGLLALYAAALDPRIDAALVSGYFDSRQDVWQEPIYRNVFGLLDEFGDAELASLVAPRALMVEACRVPQVAGPPQPRDGRNSSAAPGRLTTPSVATRASRVRSGRGAGRRACRCRSDFELVASDEGDGPPGSAAALEKFLAALADGAKLAPLVGPADASAQASSIRKRG